MGKAIAKPIKYLTTSSDSTLQRISPVRSLFKIYRSPARPLSFALGKSENMMKKLLVKILLFSLIFLSQLSWAGNVGTYLLENGANPGYFLGHTGPVDRGAAERNVIIDPDKVPWILAKNSDGTFTLENAHNPGYFLGHTGPADRGTAERNVIIDPDRVPWVLITLH